jgi:hypothetical protein
MKHEGEVKKTPVALMNFQSYFLQLVRSHKTKEKNKENYYVQQASTPVNSLK